MSGYPASAPRNQFESGQRGTVATSSPTADSGDSRRSASVAAAAGVGHGGEWDPSVVEAKQRDGHHARVDAADHCTRWCCRRVQCRCGHSGRHWRRQRWTSAADRASVSQRSVPDAEEDPLVPAVSVHHPCCRFPYVGKIGRRFHGRPSWWRPAAGAVSPAVACRLRSSLLLRYADRNCGSGEFVNLTGFLCQPWIQGRPWNGLEFKVPKKLNVLKMRRSLKKLARAWWMRIKSWQQPFLVTQSVWCIDIGVNRGILSRPWILERK